MNENFRYFAFCNFMLSSIQQGIQAGHCMQDMTRKYRAGSDRDMVVEAHTLHDKVWIVKNGVEASDIIDIVSLFDNELNPYPWCYFKESKSALGGSITCAGIILPESVWGSLSSGQFGDPARLKYIQEIINLLARTHLAR